MPAQMPAAPGAQNMAPAEPGKPGELRHRLPLTDHAWGPRKAANLKDDAAGIEKGMLVAPAALDPEPLVGDGMTAGPTKDQPLLPTAGPRQLFVMRGRPPARFHASSRLKEAAAPQRPAATRSPRHPLSVAVFLACLCLQFFIGLSAMAMEDAIWSIGIYEGRSLTSLEPAPGANNPVLTAQQVTDADARFVADPFMLQTSRGWFMFFEVMNQRTNQGDIGLATSPDGKHWRYERIVLDEPFSLSFPCVFQHEGAFYMVPESWQAGAIRLYRADSFPLEWRLVSEIIPGPFVDPSVFRAQDRWWIFAENSPRANGTLRLYSATTLTGPWREHPASPIIHGDDHIARPGGRVVVQDKWIVRFAQDDAPVYGQQVWGFDLTLLTTTSYAESPLGATPLLSGSGLGWNSHGMHHVDPHPVGGGRWLACVDGFMKGP